MFSSLAEVEAAIRTQIAELDPAALDALSAVEAMERFDRIERLAATGRALAVAAVDTTDAWHRSPQRDIEGFVAAHSGLTRRGARDGLDTVAHLSALPLLDEAVRSGEVSIDQATEISAAAIHHPEVEAELIELAGRASRRKLRERCLAIRARGQGAEDLHRQAKAERSASSRVGRDGAWHLHVSLPVSDGAIVDKVLDFFQTEVFDEARQQGDREPFAAYRADALVRMARAMLDRDGGGSSCDGTCSSSTRKRRRRGAPRARSSALRHAIIVTVPHSIFSGRAAGDGEEVCQIPGVGPVPVSVVNEILDSDPIIKAVVTNGRDITATATVTRNIKDDLRLAVRMSNGMACGVPSCDNDRFLELDHEHEFHKGGITAYENLRPLCCFHHDQRSNEGYDLRGSPGSYEWVAPDGTVLAAERSAIPVCSRPEPLPLHIPRAP